MTYTERIDGFQIMDVTYIGLPPKDAPPQYDIVKWVDCEPHEVIDGRTGKKKTITEYCYVVATVVLWDAGEGFDIEGVGLRLLEAHPSIEVMDMILDFCEKKAAEFHEED